MKELKKDLIQAGYTADDLALVRSNARRMNAYWAEDDWMSCELYKALRKQAEDQQNKQL